MFVGWDWGNSAHDMTVIDDNGVKVHRSSVPDTEVGITAAITRLAEFGDPSKLPVAIETTRGLVVDRLTVAGHPVIPVHPNAFHAARPRWGAARAKTDPGDSYKLADYARTDGHRLPRLQPTIAATRELQTLTRTRGDQLELRIAAVNQLAALLDQYWPGGKAVFAALHSAIAIAFLTRYPTASSAAKITTKQLESFCRKHGYSGRRSGADLLERLRTAPTPNSSISDEIIAQVITAQTRVVRTLQASIDGLDKVIAEKVEQHPYAALLSDLPRIGTLNLAQIIGEVGQILERANSFDQFAAETGIAPVTRASGKSHIVGFRHATNRRARQALHTWFDNSRHGDPWAHQRYADARARGQRHPHALRTLGRSWLRIVWACWRTQTPYNPAHRASRKLPDAA